MRKLIAITLGLGVLAVAACGSSSTTANSCSDTGGICLKSGAACGDTLPFSCPSGGVCCSPGTKAAPASETPEVEPAAR